jgi:hypothetical protein
MNLKEPAPSLFLMLSLSKHEEGATDPRHSQVHAAAQMG